MAYKQKQKLGAMPEYHDEGDREWVNKMLSYFPSHPTDDSKDVRGKLCRAYSKVFVEAVSLETNPIKKINAGRYAANTRLRLYVEKHFRVFDK